MHRSSILRVCVKFLLICWKTDNYVFLMYFVLQLLPVTNYLRNQETQEHLSETRVKKDENDNRVRMRYVGLTTTIQLLWQWHNKIKFNTNKTRRLRKPLEYFKILKCSSRNVLKVETVIVNKVNSRWYSQSRK